jgi:PAS domain S-box-containing protein
LDVFFVALYNPETNMVSYPLVFDHGQRWQEPDTELVPEAYSSQVLRTGKSMLVLASPEELERDRQSGASVRIGDYAEVSASMIYVPMFIKGRIIGTLSAQSYTLNVYTEDHLNFLEGVANQVAIAIENARLFTNVQQELAERQRAEGEARRIEELYRHAIESAGAVPYYRDYRSQAYTFMGEDIQKITGYTAAEMTPALWTTLEREGFPRGSMAHLTYKEADRLSEEGLIDNWECDYRIITRDGQTRWVADSGIKVKDEQGARVGVIGILQDITERKRAEEIREKLIRELEQRNAELEQLAYTLSHELKSPLITISGFMGYLREDALSGNMDRLETDIQRITDGAEKMRRLTSELIALMSIGRITHESKEIPVRELVDEAVALVSERIVEKNIAVQIADDFSHVYGDQKRLLEVFQNLLENSIKFMGEQPEPRIEIGQRSEPGAAPIFYIRDNGMGIDSRFFNRIFGIFQKLDAQSDGTGIGLALVKRNIEVHAGRIWVESEGLGKGSTFCFTIPDSRK